MMHETEFAIYLDVELLRGLEDLSPPGPDSLVSELTNLFTESTPALLKELNTAVVSGQVLVASRLAHRLKGSSANIGAKHMSVLCAQLEKSAQVNPADDNLKLVEQITASFTASTKVLQAHIKASRQK
jgi:HPt (histidine-containing phosphotransfer) domain-containing protein